MVPDVQQICAHVCIHKYFKENLYSAYKKHPTSMQAVKDGKSIIIEGMHIDPGLYLYEFAHCGLQHLQTSPAYRSPVVRSPLPTLKSRLSRAQQPENEDIPNR